MHKAQGTRHKAPGSGLRAPGTRHQAPRLRAQGSRHTDRGGVADFSPASAAHRATRAVPPFITRSTSGRVTMLVSPGVVMASAPCAAPHSTAHCAPRSVRKP